MNTIITNLLAISSDFGDIRQNITKADYTLNHIFELITECETDIQKIDNWDEIVTGIDIINDYIVNSRDNGQTITDNINNLIHLV